jgi:hypothetical protein
VQPRLVQKPPLYVTLAAGQHDAVFGCDQDDPAGPVPDLRSEPDALLKGVEVPIRDHVGTFGTVSVEGRARKAV